MAGRAAFPRRHGSRYHRRRSPPLGARHSRRTFTADPSLCRRDPSGGATADVSRFLSVGMSSQVAVPNPSLPPSGAAVGEPGIRRGRLVAIKLLHTLVWAFFAGCIVAIPIASWRGDHRLAVWLAAAVAVEVVVLLCNRWSCPLTAVAARHTDDRRANFDIYLPLWLAQHNKTVFGLLYVAGVLFAAVRWASAAG